jgi:heme exporter protein A
MTLQASQLACARGKRTLFDAVNFEVGPGEALRVVGRNGSGKTSLLRVLCGLSEPLAGDVRWQGQTVSQWGGDFNRGLVYLGHHAALKDDLTAAENVQTQAILSGQACSPEQAVGALSAFGLKSRAHLPARVLSQGQRRRVALARLALQPAKLAILDEPFNALDQESVHVLGELLASQLAQGAVVVYTTHQDQTLAATRHHTLHLGGEA